MSLYCQNFDVITLALWQTDPSGVLCQIVCKTTAQLSRDRYSRILHYIPVKASKYRKYRDQQDRYTLGYSNWPGYLETVTNLAKRSYIYRIFISRCIGDNIQINVENHQNTFPIFPEKSG